MQTTISPNTLNSDSRPIGIFDSGLGGLTVLKEIVKLVPNENIVYLGDTARVPYGTRSREAVISFAREDVSYLLSKNVKVVVVACNTVSAQALEDIRKQTTLPIVDVVSSGVRGALRVTKTARIGIMATRGTVKSHTYEKEITKSASNSKVFEIECPLLVPVIEEGELQGELIDILIKRYLEKIESFAIDTLVLGCTHYPLIENSIRKRVGPSIALINSGQEVAFDLMTYLETSKIEKNAVSNPGKIEINVTDKTNGFVKVAEDYLGWNVRDTVTKVDLCDYQKDSVQ